jgi:hypothetical protein
MVIGIARESQSADLPDKDVMRGRAERVMLALQRTKAKICQSSELRMGLWPTDMNENLSLRLRLSTE